jgi:hypothetical protein
MKALALTLGHWCSCARQAQDFISALLFHAGVELLWRFYCLAAIATHEAERHGLIIRIKLFRLRLGFGIAPEFDPVAHLEKNAIVSSLL